MYPLPTRLARLGLRALPQHLPGYQPGRRRGDQLAAVRFRLFALSPCGVARHVGDGPYLEDHDEALFRALLLHPAGRAALWPPPGALAFRRQEH